MTEPPDADALTATLDDLREERKPWDRCEFCDQKAVAVLRYVVNETAKPGSGGSPGKTVLNRRVKACDYHSVSISRAILQHIETGK